MNSVVGYDISPDMVRLSLVNMYLHGFQTPKIYEYDSLTSDERWNDTFDIILANPPFMTPKGGIRPHKRFQIQANRSEVLFVDYIMEHIATDGRAGVIVPEGIIFQSGNAYKLLRKTLVENNYLYAVVSLPAGVFNPYAGVKTSILLMDRTLAKRTKDILFIKIDNDGFDLGAQRREIDKNDLPDALRILKEYKNIFSSRHSGLDLESSLSALDSRLRGNDIRDIFHFVPKSKIAESGDYNLAGDRYRERIIHVHKEWPMVEVRKICMFEYGKPLKDENRIKGGFPVYGSNGIVGWHNEFLVEAPFLVVGRKGSAGSVHYSEQNGFPIDTTFFIKLENENHALLKFLYYCLQKLDLKNLNTQSGVPGLNRNDAYRLKIPLPPLSVQQEIVAEIDGYQKIIDGAKQIVENYKPKIQQKENWKSCTLGEVITLQRGYDLPKQEWREGRYPIVGSNGIIGYHNSYKQKGPGVVTGRSGTIGKIHYIDTDYYWPHNTSLFVVDFKGNYAKFIYYLLQELDLKSLGERTSAVPSLDRKNAHLLPVTIPDHKTQIGIAKKLDEEQRIVDENKKLIEIFEGKIKAKIAEVWG
jgi:type I restriction enzyme M protein